MIFVTPTLAIILLNSMISPCVSVKQCAADRSNVSVMSDAPHCVVLEFRISSRCVIHGHGFSSNVFTDSPPTTRAMLSGKSTGVTWIPKVLY